MTTGSDECAIAGGAADCDDEGVPDSCSLAGGDCNGDGILDTCQLVEVTIMSYSPLIEADVYAMNGTGAIVGASGPAPRGGGGGGWEAYRYHPSTGVEMLGTLGGEYSEAFGISENGRVAGYAEDSNFDTWAFRYTDVAAFVTLLMP